jgi:2-oxo-4-hydroxy-4-carboxy-5-ureidoimidazoline decarboxylase
MDIYGGIYEHSPWVAAAVWQRHIPETVDTPASLHFAMKEVVEAAGEDRQLALLRAHPDLGGRAAVRGELTTESTAEQKGAGLDQCSPEEFAELQTLNSAYQEKFDFPFIIAVRGLNRTDILENFRRRVAHSSAKEFRTALEEVHKIALLRLVNLEVENK